MSKMQETLTARGLHALFWQHVRRGAAHRCWRWKGYRNSDGYGQYTARGLGTLLAHRVAFELSKGPIPAKAVVRHACDNPACCNPLHLLIGSHADNVRDRDERGRAAWQKQRVPAENPRTLPPPKMNQARRRLIAMGLIVS